MMVVVVRKRKKLDLIFRWMIRSDSGFDTRIFGLCAPALYFTFYDFMPLN